MRFNLTFEIEAVCNHFKQDDKEFVEKDLKLNLKMTKEQASNFIFRFAPSVFKIEDDYTIILRFNDMHKMTSIMIMKEKDIYNIINIDDVLMNILEAYMEIRSSEKILTILENNDILTKSSNEVIDEFEIEGRG